MRRNVEESLFQSRLREILTEERDSLEGVDLRLEQAIQNAGGTGVKIDRRRLKSIIDGDDVRLSFAELQALDTFLTRKQRGGLKALFENSTILRVFANKEKVTFLVGAKPSQHTTNLARYDVRALSDLLPAIDRISPGIHFEIEDMLRRTRPLPSGEGPPPVTYENETWYKRLQDPANSLVCLGSPRSCTAAEILLAEMMGLTPFQETLSEGGEKPPFFFLWSDNTALASTFALPSSLPSNSNPVDGNWPTIGIQIGDSRILVDRKSNIWDEYGFFALQRRKTGQIWLVISGLTGPATYATSKFVEACTAVLPPASLGTHSPVLWAVVKTTVQWFGDREGDRREVLSKELYHGPIIRPAPR